jgi:uncharacterized protein (TIGR03545 family)
LLQESKKQNYGRPLRPPLSLSGTTNMTTSTDKNSSETLEPSKKPKKVKKKGPIRFEAIIPIAVIVLGLFLYGKFALDSNLRTLTIWSLEQAHGAEVNLKSVNLSLFKGSLQLKELQITDKKNPKNNVLAVEKIGFNLNTYELLKAKFIVENSQVSGISWGTPRKKEGRVFKGNERKSEQLEKLEQSTIKTAQEQFQGNALGNVANVLGGTKERDEIKAIKSELITEKKIKELEAEFKGKEESYKRRLKELKDQTALKEVKSEVRAYKWDKRNPIKSISKLNKLVKKANGTYKQYSNDIKAIKNDLKTVKNVSKNVDKWIEEDMKNLQSKVGIPELDAEAIAFSMFGNYFGTNVAQYRKYSEIAKEYMPPPKGQRTPKDQLIPPARGEGKTINFPKVGENPKYWIKKVEISSQAGKSEYGGNLKGQITDITSSPKIINKPVEIKVTGAFPKQKLFGIALDATLDHRDEQPKQNLALSIDQMPFEGKTLSKSSSLGLKLKPAPAKVKLEASMLGDNAKVELNAGIKNPKFELSADKKIIQESLGNILNGLKVLSLRAKATGKWEDLKWNMRSNLGSEISKGLKAELGKRVAGAKKKLRQQIDKKIGPQKKKLDSLVNNFKKDIDSKLDAEKGRAGQELKNLTADLKKKQGSSLKKKAKSLFKSKDAKKLLKKLF